MSISGAPNGCHMCRTNTAGQITLCSVHSTLRLMSWEVNPRPVHILTNDEWEALSAELKHLRAEVERYRSTDIMLSAMSEEAQRQDAGEEQETLCPHGTLAERCLDHD